MNELRCIGRSVIYDAYQHPTKNFLLKKEIERFQRIDQSELKKQPDAFNPGTEAFKRTVALLKDLMEKIVKNSGIADTIDDSQAAVYYLMSKFDKKNDLMSLLHLFDKIVNPDLAFISPEEKKFRQVEKIKEKLVIEKANQVINEKELEDTLYKELEESLYKELPEHQTQESITSLEVDKKNLLLTAQDELNKVFINHRGFTEMIAKLKDGSKLNNEKNKQRLLIANLLEILVINKNLEAFFNKYDPNLWTEANLEKLIEQKNQDWIFSGIDIIPIREILSEIKIDELKVKINSIEDEIKNIQKKLQLGQLGLNPVLSDQDYSQVDFDLTQSSSSVLGISSITDEELDVQRAIEASLIDADVDLDLEKALEASRSSVNKYVDPDFEKAVQESLRPNSPSKSDSQKIDSSFAKPIEMTKRKKQEKKISIFEKILSFLAWPFIKIGRFFRNLFIKKRVGLNYKR